MNTQPIEKQVRDDGTLLAVNSIFYTIQGEGPFAGTPAVFVRLAGCNLRCPMCDTEYTKRDSYSIREIVDLVRDAIPYWPSGHKHDPEPCRAPSDLVVITGGEPFRQTIGPLIQALINHGYRVQVETNGTLFQNAPYSSDRLTVVCSPKTGKVNKDLLPWIKAWKYVATADSIDPTDGLPRHALEHPNNGRLYRPPSGTTVPIYLQPVDEQDPAANARNLDAVVRACLEHGHRLCIQIHKLIGVP